MDKKCTTCAAPMTGKKCEYCRKRIEKNKGISYTETPDSNDIETVTYTAEGSSAVSLNHSDSLTLSTKRNILLLITYVGGMTILPIIVALVTMLIGGLDPFTMTSEENLNVMTAGIVVSYGLLTLALLLLTHAVFREDFRKIKSWRHFSKQMGLGLLCTFGAAMIGGILLQLVGVNETAANQEAVEAALRAMPLAMVFSVVLFAPIIEEIIFRLVLMKLFNWKPVYQILFSSFIFGLVHVLTGGLIHIIPYFLIGLVFGVIYHKNQNIWHATILHILHNGLTLVLLVMT